MITKLIWRVKFTLAVRKIFSKPKGAFKGNNFKLGWKLSSKLYNKYKNESPWESAVEEITDWYCI